MPDENNEDVKDKVDDSSQSTDVKDQSDSSTDKDGKEPASLAAAIAAVTDKAKGDEDSSTSDEGDISDANKTDDKTKKDGDKEPAAQDDKDSKQSPRDQRIKEVLSERDSANQQYERAKPLVEQATALNEYCQANAIKPKQVTEALKLLALLNNNPAEARKMLQPTLDYLDKYQDGKLPNDLANEVTEGTITEARAKEIASLRAQQENLKHVNSRSQQTYEQQVSSARTAALNSWDMSKRGNDPDFAPKKNDAPDGKYELVVLKLKELAQTNPPQTPDQFVALAEKAYDAVNKTVQSFRPRPRQTKPSLSSNGSQTNSHDNTDITKFKSLSEVTKHVLAQGRA